jgi:hypothetical protein
MVSETLQKFNAWMPLSKSVNGGFVGILSDNSLDRDGEFMTKELLQSWAEKMTPLPMLANHENKMEKFIGGWTEKQLVTNGDRSALTAKPFFFSKEANPLAFQIQKQVEEALEKGMNIGISIGAIPHSTIEKEIDGKMHKGFDSAEIVEATVVPIQSNRNASFTAMAKQFNLLEDTKMSEVELKKDAPEVTESPAEPAVEVPVEEKLEELSEEKPAEEPVEEQVAEEPVAEPEEKESEVDLLKQELAELKKAFSDFRNTSIKKAKFEKGYQPAESEAESITVESMLKRAYRGGQ